MGRSCVKAVIVVGMPGSGKSVFTEVAEEMGLEVYVMGDIVREEVVSRGIPLTRENLIAVAKDLRRSWGNDVVARRIVEKILKGRASQSCGEVVIDGSRSLEELRIFRESFSRTLVVGIHASPATRFERLRSRGREGDPKTWEGFVERDMAELSMGIGSVIALSDYMVVNEGLSLEELRRILRDLLEKILGILREGSSRSPAHAPIFPT